MRIAPALVRTSRPHSLKTVGLSAALFTLGMAVGSGYVLYMLRSPGYLEWIAKKGLAPRLTLAA